jgi:hypothetical protein
VTGVFNTFRLGVLKAFYENDFNPKSKEVSRYIQLYENFQKLKKKDGKVKDLEMVSNELNELETKDRVDVIYMLRKAINERFYGKLK